LKDKFNKECRINQDRVNAALTQQDDDGKMLERLSAHVHMAMGATATDGRHGGGRI
jgi:hypothetical protein